MLLRYPSPPSLRAVEQTTPGLVHCRGSYLLARMCSDKSRCVCVYLLMCTYGKRRVFVCGGLCYFQRDVPTPFVKWVQSFEQTGYREFEPEHCMNQRRRRERGGYLCHYQTDTVINVFIDVKIPAGEWILYACWQKEPQCSFYWIKEEKKKWAMIMKNKRLNGLEVPGEGTRVHFWCRLSSYPPSTCLWTDLSVSVTAGHLPDLFYGRTTELYASDVVGHFM